jgi:hypothetical protein
MSIVTRLPIDEIARRGTIRESDVSVLRAAWRDAEAIDERDADALFELHGACPVKAPAWCAFFVEALTEYVVQQAKPEGYVVAENARWLLDKIGAFGRVETSTELALLIHVLETARWTPPSLAAFALAQVREAVASGTGPLRAGRPLIYGEITPLEIELVGRILKAFGGDTSLAVTRAEADALLAINRAIAPGQAPIEWQDLLVRSVGTAVLAALGHSVPSRAEIAGSDDEDGATAIGKSRDAVTAVNVWSSARVLLPEERALARLERQRLEIVTNEVIEEASEAWLLSELGQSPSLDENEIALLAYLTREASRLPPGLAAFAREALAA